MFARGKALGSFALLTGLVALVAQSRERHKQIASDLNKNYGINLRDARFCLFMGVLGVWFANVEVRTFKLQHDETRGWVLTDSGMEVGARYFWDFVDGAEKEMRQAVLA